MIKALQRRFVLTAMLSLFVLLVILVGGITVASYISMERSTDITLEMLSSDMRTPPPNENERRPFFGYQINPNPLRFANRAIVIVDTEDEIVSIDAGFNTAYDDEISGYAADILASGKSEGKIGSFKYTIAPFQDGGRRIIFLDVSVQARMLADTVRVAALISLICMVLMFIISVLMSRPTVKPIADNVEKQRRFVTDAGHEIKTPLAIIQTNIDAMELHLGENKWSKRIREQTLRLGGLMKQLLSLSKMDEGDPTSPFEEVLLSELVEKCVSSFSELDADKQLDAHITPHMTMRGNKDSLEQLISILLDNAVKYSQPGSAITVKLFPNGKKSVLEVVNTCSMLPDAEPRTLFDRFYRADSARTQKSGGYGIGLSIARAITELHKGKITAHYDDEHTIRFSAQI